MFLFRLFHSAEADQRLASGFLLRHAPLHVLFDRKFQMRRHLRIEFRIPLRVAKERTHTIHRLPYRAHHTSPSTGIASTRSTTLDNLCQWAASLASCLRPLLVME